MGLDHSYGGWRYVRTTEQFSFFIVLTKEFGVYGLYNIGIGRGIFVGYGPRSQLFNTDKFFYDLREFHNDAIGFFLGQELYLFSHCSFMWEFDGRDLNMGIEFRSTLFQFGISFSKMEFTLWKPPVARFSRLAMGISTTSYLWKKIRKEPLGELVINVVDAEKGTPLRAILSFPGTSLPFYQTDGKTGQCKIQLEPGVYRVRVSAFGRPIRTYTVFTEVEYSAEYFFRLPSIKLY
jgi:hypothetical protein